MVEVRCKIQISKVGMEKPSILYFFVLFFFFYARKERVRIEVHLMLICIYFVFISPFPKKKWVLPVTVHFTTSQFV